MKDHHPSCNELDLELMWTCRQCGIVKGAHLFEEAALRLAKHLTISYEGIPDQMSVTKRLAQKVLAEYEKAKLFEGRDQ